MSLSLVFLGCFLYVSWVKCKTLGFLRWWIGPSASCLENRFSVLNLSIVSLTKLLCCSLGSSCDFFWLRLLDSWWLVSLIYFSTYIITTALPFHALVVIISFLFTSSSTAFCHPLDRFGFWIFHIFLFFCLFRSFCTKSINVLTLWWVPLGVHFCLFFYLDR